MLRVEFHNGTGQPPSCLAGFERYAQSVRASKKAAGFPTPSSIEKWLYRQPVKLDRGEGPAAQGCYPAQRSRLWPDDGLNCWEATAHYLGVLQRLDPPLDVVVFDAQLPTGRHIFPAVRPLGSSGEYAPVMLQPPLSGSPAQAVLSLAVRAQGCGQAQAVMSALCTPRAKLRRRAQATAADVGRNAYGVIHSSGRVVLTTFGVPGIADLFEDLGRDQLPAWSKRPDPTRDASPAPTSSTPRPVGPAQPVATEPDADTRAELMEILSASSRQLAGVNRG